MAIPANLIYTINRLIRMSQRMLVEQGCEQTERLKTLVDRVKRLLEFVRRPVTLAG
jgi:hypothetical protein